MIYDSSPDDIPRLDPNVAKAFAHPIRVRLLKALNHRVASGPELAKQLHLPESNVNYHVGVLLECDCIQVATRRKRKGRDVRFYTTTPHVLYSAPHIETALLRTPATTPELQSFLQKAQSAVNAGMAELHDEATFVVEALTLTEPHRKTAEEAIHLTIANLRTLQEQSLQLNIATDTPVRLIEIGVAMFPPCTATNDGESQ